MLFILSRGIGFPACVTGHMTKGFVSRGSGSGVGGDLPPRVLDRGWGGGICLQGLWIQVCMYQKYPEIHRDTVNKRAARILLEFILVHRYLPAATKLGQGNIFTPVCDAVNMGVSNFSGEGGLVPGGCQIFLGGV